MFELSRNEIAGISQIVTFSNLKFSKRVRVFTEQGVAMLSSVLRSERAIQVNIEIMRAFVKLRQMLASNAELARRLDELESRYDRQFKVVFDAIRKLMAPPTSPRKRNAAAKIADIESVEIVFKDGVGYDSETLAQSVQGLVGIR